MRTQIDHVKLVTAQIRYQWRDFKAQYEFTFCNCIPFAPLVVCVRSRSRSDQSTLELRLDINEFVYNLARGKLKAKCLRWIRISWDHVSQRKIAKFDTHTPVGYWTTVTIRITLKQIVSKGLTTVRYSTRSRIAQMEVIKPFCTATLFGIAIRPYNHHNTGDNPLTPDNTIENIISGRESRSMSSLSTGEHGNPVNLTTFTHTKCHVRMIVIETSQQAAVTSQKMTIDWNFRNWSNWGTKWMARAEPSPPTMKGENHVAGHRLALLSEKRIVGR